MTKESWRAFLGTVGAAVVLTVFLLVAIGGLGLLVMASIDYLVSKGELVSGFICLALVGYGVTELVNLYEEWFER